VSENSEVEPAAFVAVALIRGDGSVPEEAGGLAKGEPVDRQAKNRWLGVAEPEASPSPCLDGSSMGWHRVDRERVRASDVRRPLIVVLPCAWSQAAVILEVDPVVGRSHRLRVVGGDAVASCERHGG
jgi:hypothetical protein